jgi:hypothetical protein
VSFSSTSLLFVSFRKEKKFPLFYRPEGTNLQRRNKLEEEAAAAAAAL